MRDESKYHTLNIQAQISDCAQHKASNEALYKSSPDKRLNAEHKTYQEYYKAILAQQEQLLKDTKNQQKAVRESAEVNTKQVQMFLNLKKLLEVKLRTLSPGGQREGGPKDGGAATEEYNRLVLS